MLLLVRERGEETLRKKPQNEGRRKHSKMKKKKNKEHRESQITTMNIFGFTFKKSNFARKHSLEKVVYTITFYLQVLYVAGYLERSNHTQELMWICFSV